MFTMATQAQRKPRSDKGQAQGEGPKQNHVFREFKGINTQSARQAILPGEFSWLENVQPIGFGNAKAVADLSLALASLPVGGCEYMRDYNRNGVNYMFMATTSGRAFEVAIDFPNGVTEITDSMVPQFSGALVRIDQWENSRIVIIDPVNGYFTWDGATLSGSGELVGLTITNNGSGYTAIPTISFTGGGGVGAAAMAVMGLDAPPAINTAGTGYVPNDILTFVGGTGTPAKLRVTTIGMGGAITAVSVFDSGAYTVLPTAPVAVTGGTGTAADFTPTYEVDSANVTDGGSVPYDAPPTVIFSTGAAAADALIIDFPGGGEHIAVFAGRVWISKNRTLIYSAPDSYTNFSDAGAGSTIITDPTLRSSITQLISANNFLYFTGINSVNVIGDVAINTDGETIFSNTNLSASIGTNLDLAIFPYYRSILMQNRAGVYSVYGATPTKASDKLDGITPKIDFASQISGGQVMLENILCAAFLFQYFDELETRPLLTLFFGGKWFLASQGNDITLIASSEKNGIAALFGTDGQNFYQLFARPDYPVPWTIQGKLWDMEQLWKDKAVTKFGFEMNAIDSDGQVNILLEALISQGPSQFYSATPYIVDVSGVVTWINDDDEVVEWENDDLDTVEWLGEGYFLDMEDGDIYGNYVGFTMSSDNVRGNLYSFLLEYTFRESW